jgi:hypothetical protein
VAATAAAVCECVGERAKEMDIETYPQPKYKKKEEDIVENNKTIL